MMRAFLPLGLRPWSIIFAVLCASLPGAHADPVPVRFTRGTIHGFVDLRAEDGRVVASGDLFQVVLGSQVTDHLTFHFKDGSVDDETTVFSQRRTFQLISDHHIQKGPSFPLQLDLMIDCRTGKVTVHSTGKDGKEEVKTSQLHLPADLANGIISAACENLRPGAQPAKLSMLVATPSLRLVTLSISSRGEDPFTVNGVSEKATHYEMKIVLGGAVGILAPMFGKQPPNIQIWIAGGQAPTFVREQGQLYADSPMYTIELASPTWPDEAAPGK